MRRHVILLTSTVLIIFATFAATLLSNNRPVLGLDLQGGVSIVLFPIEGSDTSALDAAVTIIRNRVDGLGIAEPEVNRQGDTIVIDLPGVKDRQKAEDLVGQTAELRFRQVQNAVSFAPTTTTTADPTKTGATTTAPNTTSTAPSSAATTVTTAPASTESPTTKEALGGRHISAQLIASARPAAGGDDDADHHRRCDDDPADHCRGRDHDDGCPAGVLRRHRDAARRADGRGAGCPSGLRWRRDVLPARTDIADRQERQRRDGVLRLERRLARRREIPHRRIRHEDRGPDGRQGSGNRARRGRRVGADDQPRDHRPDRADQRQFQREGRAEPRAGAQVRRAAHPVRPERADRVERLAQPRQGPAARGHRGGPDRPRARRALHDPVLPTARRRRLDRPRADRDDLLHARLVPFGALRPDAHPRRRHRDHRVGRCHRRLLRRVLRATEGRGALGQDGALVARHRLPRAFRTIWAADLVSLLGAVVLYYLASGSVQGFAFFLGISTVLDLVLAYCFMHPTVVLLAARRALINAPYVGIASALDVPEATA